MNIATPIAADSAALILPDLCQHLRSAAQSAEAFVAKARVSIRDLVSRDGKLDRKALDREQHAVHGFGWYATYAELFREVANWAEALEADGKFGEVEALLAQLLISEYAAQMLGGI